MTRKPRQLKDADLRHQIEKLLLKNPDKSFDTLQISRKINVANPPESIRSALLKLIAENKVFSNTKDSYSSVRQGQHLKTKNKKDELVLSGVIDLTKSGDAYVICAESDDDIFVPYKHLKGAMHKDVVSVAVQTIKKNRRPEGKIVSIEKRALSHVVGQIHRYDHYALVVPPNSKMLPEVCVQHEDMLESNQGDRVVVEITSWSKAQNKSIWGKVVKVLNNLTDVETNMVEILYSFGFDTDFPKEVIADIAQVSVNIEAEEIKLRRDFRNKTTMTIDPATAKDFDDALSYAVLENGCIEIGVHIADVSHYVKEGSLLDKEALKRSTSVYLVDRVCPMLPEKLSNDLCSLNPQEDKLTFSAVFTFNDHFEISQEWFGKTIIHSDRRFTYEEAQERIETGAGDFALELQKLHQIAQNLRKRRFEEGSINFESDEVQFILDDQNLPIGTFIKERKDAHLLVEDFMLLANKQVAYYMAHKSKPEIPFIYRVHDLPNPDKLADFALFAKELGFRFKIDSPDHIIESFNQLSIASKENPMLKLLEPLAIRTMAKAIYTTNNIGHYGLGFDYYTHFTSPIRRYSDVLVHRSLFKNLKQVWREDQELLEIKAKHISAQEKNASDAERESIKYFQTLYISKFVGQTFEGVISGMIEKGIFVELNETKVEGLVTFDSMGEIYTLQDNKLKAKSRISGQIWSMGQKVKVKIVSTDVTTRRTEMELIH